ncbi:transporter substrate-binding domain-containing protein [Planococcus sp. 1R117A]|uniref:transporter substrate-binding domain-containing protein n=1 Tax=Planococcus sp. 1R117A TaxID=3447020 RepID=UPI003EDC997C
MKKFSFLLILLSLILIVAACVQQGGESESEGEGGSEGEANVENGEGEGIYTVGIDTTYPPFEFQKSGEYQGIDVELIKAIAENQGFEIQFRPMDFIGIIPALEEGELDLAIAGMSITEERKEVLDFSDPYFDAGLTLVTAKDNTDISSLEDLDGKIIAVKSGTTGSKFVGENQEKYGYRVAYFDDSPSMFLEVANGHAVALVEDYPVISYAITTRNLELKTVGERLTDEKYGIAVLKGQHSELLEKINEGLQQLRDDGTYEEIVTKYIKS